MTRSAAFRWGAALALLAGLVVWLVFSADSVTVSPDSPPPVPRPSAATDAAPLETQRGPVRRRRIEPAPEATPDSGPGEFALDDDAPVPRGALAVHVVAADGGDAIGGARVVAEDVEGATHEAVTGADGTATFDPPIDSDYVRFFVSAPGHATFRHFADKERMRGGGTIEIRLASGVSIDGVVLDAESGLAIPGVVVSAQTGRDTRAETVTSASGAFRLESIPAGSGRTIRFTEPHHLTLDLAWGESMGPRPDVRLERAGLVRGVVTLPGGAPADWATVSAWCVADGALRATTNADARGAYVLGGLPFRSGWVVVASKPGLGDSEPTEQFELSAQSPEAVRDFSLRRPLVIEVHVLRPDGAPATDARVTLRTPSHFGSPLACDENSVRRFEIFDTRACRVRAEAPGFTPLDVDVDPTPGRVLVVEARLGTGVEITGAVVDDRGAPIPGAEVSARTEGASSWPTMRTGDDGVFRLAGVPAGPCWLVFGANDHAAGQPVAATAPASDMRVMLTRRGRVALRFKPGHAASAKPFAIRLTSSQGRTDSQLFAAEYGSAQISCDAGQWRMVLTAPGFAPLVREFTVAPGETAALPQLDPDSGTTLTGRVVDVNGSPIVGATVEVSARPIWMSLGTAISDANGAFTVEHLAAGAIHIDVDHDEFLSGAVEYEFGPGSDRPVITLRTIGTLQGTLRDAGEPAVDVKIEAVPGADDAGRVTMTTNAKGEFHAALRPGRWRLSVSRASGETVVYDAEVRDGATTVLELTR